MHRAAATRSLSASAKPRRRGLGLLLDDFELILLSLPSILWYLAFCYAPLFGLVIAFKNYKVAPGKGFLYSLFVRSKWVGFKNFEFLFKSPDVAIIFRNTIGYNLAFILIGLVLPVTLAILISQVHSSRLAKGCQTAMFLPHFLSWVVVSYFVYAFLATDRGLINSLLKSVGGETITWYQRPEYWPFILVFLNTWKTVGYSMVVYLASITGIDQSLYESAVIDGATKWQQVKGITLPMLRPIISILFIMNVGHIFSSDFGLFYHATRDSGSLSAVTQTIDVYVYKALMERSNYAYASASGLMQSVLGCVMIVASNYIVKRIDPESGFF
ncbi:MAG: ABC transporter permease subunit [Oscillospiraceae bacterium]|jgi:putative aldouronate transport system permease protein|nr:ABC transporter permease subunit [Oscillospiraceae bacterium]